MSFHEITRFPAERSQLAKIRRFIELHAEKTPATPDEVHDLVLAVDEAATNIIVHGYRDGKGEVEVDMHHQPGSITVILRDRAPFFDPTTVPEPNLHLPLHKRPLGGLGVHLIRCCVNEFSHSALPNGGNEVRMVKLLKDSGGLE